MFRRITPPMTVFLVAMVVVASGLLWPVPRFLSLKSLK
jgi:hypothetical protein